MNEIVALEGDELTLEVHCSKGTYVRTIALELGEQLGFGPTSRPCAGWLPAPT